MASEDPSGLGPDSNPYRYVGNGTTNWVDPDGRQKQAPGRPRDRVAELRELIRIGQATKDRTLESGAIEALARERVIRDNKLGIDDARQMTCERGDPLDNLRGFVSGAATTAVSVVLEPVDWALTAWEIYKDPKNPLSYASLLPLVPVQAAKAAKKVSVVLNREAGIAAEQAAGIVKNTSRIDSISGTAGHRIPDELDLLSSRTLREVKNCGRLSFTLQIQDYLHFAIREDLTFVLRIAREITSLT